MKKKLSKLQINSRNLRCYLSGDILIVCNRHIVYWMSLWHAAQQIQANAELQQDVMMKKLAESFEMPDHTENNYTCKHHEFKVFGQVLLGIFRHSVELPDETYHFDTLVCKHIGPHLKSSQPAFSNCLKLKDEWLYTSDDWTNISYFYDQGVVFTCCTTIKRWHCESHRQYMTSSSLQAYHFSPEEGQLHFVCAVEANKSALPVSRLSACHDLSKADYCESSWFANIKKRVFSFIEPDSHQPCLWIHCYHKRNFIPIGSSTLGVRGLFALDGCSVMSFSHPDQNDFFVRRRLDPYEDGKPKTELVSRLYLRW